MPLEELVFDKIDFSYCIWINNYYKSWSMDNMVYIEQYFQSKIQ